jgi:hypothetical protein
VSELSSQPEPNQPRFLYIEHKLAHRGATFGGCLWHVPRKQSSVSRLGREGLVFLLRLFHTQLYVAYRMKLLL